MIMLCCNVEVDIDTENGDEIDDIKDHKHDFPTIYVLLKQSFFSLSVFFTETSNA